MGEKQLTRKEELELELAITKKLERIENNRRKACTTALSRVNRAADQKRELLLAEVPEELRARFQEPQPEVTVEE